MSDTTKCEDEECPLKDTCFRYVSKPDKDWQAYFTETPYDGQRGKCDYYWEHHGLEYLLKEIKNGI